MALIAVFVLSFVFNALHGHAVTSNGSHDPSSFSIIDGSSPAPEKASGGECSVCVAGQLLLLDQSGQVAVDASRTIWMPSGSPSIQSRKLASLFRPPIV